MNSISYASPLTSRFLVKYYRAPEHRAKQRLWRWIRRAQGYSRLQTPYHGGWITLDERDLLQRCILRDGFYEREVWDSLLPHVTANSCFWDVGAHIGTFSVLALSDPRIVNVQAFEPNPRTRSILSRHAKLNRPSITVHGCAVGDADTDLELNLPPDENTGLASLSESFGGGTVKVPVRTIDTLIYVDRLPPPSILKIDVENWEENVLLGGKRFMAENRPKAIVLEAACDPTGGFAAPTLEHAIRSIGFRAQRISRPDGHLETRENYLLTPRDR